MNDREIALFKHRLAMKVVDDYFEYGEITEDTYDFIELYFQAIADKLEIDREWFCKCQKLCSPSTGTLYNNWLLYTDQDNEHWGWVVNIPMLNFIFREED